MRGKPAKAKVAPIIVSNHVGFGKKIIFGFLISLKSPCVIISKSPPFPHTQSRLSISLHVFYPWLSQQVAIRRSPSLVPCNPSYNPSLLIVQTKIPEERWPRKLKEGLKLSGAIGGSCSSFLKVREEGVHTMTL